MSSYIILTDDDDEQRLPVLPILLADWAWEIAADRRTVRLAYVTEGYATGWYGADGLEACIEAAAALIERDMAIVAAEEPEAEIVPTFRYAALAAEQRVVVQQLTREIRDELEAMKQSSRKIGERLLTIKEQLGYGEFGAWLKAEFGWSHDTANNWMNVARLAQQNPNYSEFEDSFSRTALTTLARPGTPAAAREEAAERAASGEVITAAAAKEIVAAHKPAPPPPHGWEAWRARAQALGGDIVVSGGGFIYSSAKGDIPTGSWAHVQESICIDEIAERNAAFAARAAATAPTTPPGPAKPTYQLPPDWAIVEKQARNVGYWIRMDSLDGHFEVRKQNIGYDPHSPPALAYAHDRWDDCVVAVRALAAKPAAPAQESAPPAVPPAVIIAEAEGGELYAEVEHWIADLLEKLSPTDQLLLNFLLGDWEEGNAWDDLTQAALVKEATDARTLSRLLAEHKAEAVAA